MRRSLPFCLVMLLVVSCEQPEPKSNRAVSRYEERVELMQAFPQVSPEVALRAYPDGGEITRHSEEESVKLTLYQTNKTSLATLELLLPGACSSGWTKGQWRGELASTYVWPGEHVSFAHDLSKAPSWRPFEYRIDAEDFRFIFINLQPEDPMDNIRLWIPVGKRSSLESSWYHWTDAGGFEGGAVRILERTNQNLEKL